MIRYTNQRDKHSCGPVAILNVLKWLGYQVPLRSKLYKKIYKYSDCNRNGTHHNGLDAALRYFTKKEASIKRSRRPKYSNIRRHILSGGCVILAYGTVVKTSKYGRYEHGHYTLLISATDKTFKAINLHWDQNISIITKNTLQKMLRRKKRHTNLPEAWFISPL